MSDVDVTTGTMEQPWLGSAGTYWLEVADGKQHRSFLIARGVRLLVGTRRECDIMLSDRMVSGLHCEVELRDNHLCVRDLGSKNGTYVGGARLSSAQLVAGACFLVGRVPISVRAQPFDGSRVKPLDGMIGNSAAMMRVASEVRRLAPLSVPVLICGATGTGKELVARSLHDLSARKQGPFVPINVGAIPSSLAVAELFGHERGAFTDAQRARRGAFVAAQGGTLFLDEIGEIGADVQVMLLRALEQREVQPLGSDQRVQVDVRVIAATCARLENAMNSGRFRRDLYHRLAVGTVHLPPLSERKTDIAALASHIVELHASEVGEKQFTPAALARLMVYGWPGNVRELSNVVLRAASRARDAWITAEDVDEALGRTNCTQIRIPRDSAWAIVEQCGGSVSAAARHCRVPRTTFRGWLKGRKKNEEANVSD